MSPARRWVSGWLSQKVRSTRIQQFQLDSLDPRILQMVRSDIDVVANRPLEKQSPQKDQSQLDAIKAMFSPVRSHDADVSGHHDGGSAHARKRYGGEESSDFGGAYRFRQPFSTYGGKLLGNVAGSMVIFLLYWLRRTLCPQSTKPDVQLANECRPLVCHLSNIRCTLLQLHLSGRWGLG